MAQISLLQNIYSKNQLDGYIAAREDRKKSLKPEEKLGFSFGDRVKFGLVSFNASIQTVAFIALDAVATALKWVPYICTLSLVSYAKVWKNFSDHVTEISHKKYGAASVAFTAFKGVFSPDSPKTAVDSAVEAINKKPAELQKAVGERMETLTKNRQAQRKKEADKVTSNPNTTVEEALFNGRIQVITGRLTTKVENAIIGFAAIKTNEKYSRWMNAQSKVSSAESTANKEIRALPLNGGKFNEHCYNKNKESADNLRNEFRVRLEKLGKDKVDAVKGADRDAVVKSSVARFNDYFFGVVSKDANSGKVVRAGGKEKEINDKFDNLFKADFKAFNSDSMASYNAYMQFVLFMRDVENEATGFVQNDFKPVPKQPAPANGQIRGGYSMQQGVKNLAVGIKNVAANVFGAIFHGIYHQENAANG